MRSQSRNGRSVGAIMHSDERIIETKSKLKRRKPTAKNAVGFQLRLICKDSFVVNIFKGLLHEFLKLR